MQDLLGRISALDPDASIGIRIIACFDELTVGRVNTQGLLATAAALAGCASGCSWPDGTTMRVDENGHVLQPAAEGPAALGSRIEQHIDEASTVWLERSGGARANDAIILERLGLALRIRRGQQPQPDELRRPFAVLVDASEAAEARRDAAHQLRLDRFPRWRVIVAPLFAVWQKHPDLAGDVVPTPFGPVHALALPEHADTPEASPMGIGTLESIDGLPRSFSAALVALRLTEPSSAPAVSADRFGGLVDILASNPSTTSPDVALIDALSRHSWAERTISALCESTTVRQAARAAGVHHSTLQSRADIIAHTMGFDVFEAMGRTRLTLAFLMWKLNGSKVLELPAPGEQQRPRR